MTRKELFQAIRENQSEINSRMRGVREESERMDIPSAFADTQKELFKQLTGVSKGRTGEIGIGKITSMKKAKLESIYAQQQQFLKSKWSTAEGRESIRRAQFASLKRGGKYENLTYDSFIHMTRFMAKQPRLYTELMEDNAFGSDNVLDLISDYHFTSDDLLNAFDKIEKADATDLRRGTWKNYLKDVMENPEKEIDEIYAKYKRVRSS